jgi:hypothetical protein
MALLLTPNTSGLFKSSFRIINQQGYKELDTAEHMDEDRNHMDTREQYGFGLLLLAGIVLNTISMALLTESMVLAQDDTPAAFPVLLYLTIIGVTTYSGVELVIDIEGTRRLVFILLVILLVGMFIISPVLPVTWVGMVGLNVLFVLGLVDLLLNIVIIIYAASR